MLIIRNILLNRSAGSYDTREYHVYYQYLLEFFNLAYLQLAGVMLDKKALEFNKIREDFVKVA